MFKECSSDESFFIGMKIHAICADANIDLDKTRLLTYMHFKIKDNGNDINYFDHESENDCLAIEVMLGNMTPLHNFFSENCIGNKNTAVFKEYCSSIANNIRKLDSSFRKNIGMENRLSGELRKRLRLYRDKIFRNEMMRLYKEIILPRIELYELCTIKRAFKQARERANKSEFAN